MFMEKFNKFEYLKHKKIESMNNERNSKLDE